MDEVAEIKKAVDPHETLFIVDSMTGQDAVNTAKEFNETINYDGVVLTKLDGDTRGGAALSIKNVVQKPIKFVSTGEKLDALSPFYPERMSQRILGMGAGKALQDADTELDEDAFKPIEAIICSMTPEEKRNPDILNATRKRRIAKGSGTRVSEINDLLKQFEQMKKMMQSFSGMGKIGQMMQGMKGMKGNLPFG